MKNTVIAKLGAMKKNREWSVMPIEGGSRILVQADGAIGVFQFRTGKGKLCTRGGYFPHLAIAKPFQFPAEFIQQCLAVWPSLGLRLVLRAETVIHSYLLERIAPGYSVQSSVSECVYR